jgi:hypothetical protein
MDVNFGDVVVIARFSSPLVSCTEGLFLFTYEDLSSLFDESRAKNIHFSTYTCPISYTTSVYAGWSTTAYVHQDLCQKIQKWSWVSMSRQDISDPWLSIYWKHSELALQLHFESYKSTILSYGKEEKEFNFESNVTLEKLLNIEFASHCPSSLNTVFSPQDLSILLREPHCLSPLIFPLVED